MGRKRVGGGDSSSVECMFSIAPLPDVLKRGHDGPHVRAGRQEAEADEVAGHGVVVLVHRVYHRTLGS